MQTLVLAKLVYGPHSQISMRIMSLSFFTFVEISACGHQHTPVQGRP